MPGTDMEEWYREVGYILSTSDSEGCHTSIMEGMASGCEPIVCNWPGADQLFPPEYVYENLDDAIDRLANRSDDNLNLERMNVFKGHIKDYDSDMFVEFLLKLMV